jgi:hypothetical protein
MKVHIDQNPKPISGFVWNVLQQFPGILHAHRVSLVVLPEDKNPTTSVCESANPLQVFVTPGFFPFDGLMFGHFEKLVSSRAVFMSPGARSSASTVAAGAKYKVRRRKEEVRMSFFMVI